MAEKPGLRIDSAATSGVDGLSAFKGVASLQHTLSMIFPTFVADSDYLKAISRNVGHWEVNASAALLLLLVGCAVVGAVCLHLGLKKLRSIRNPDQPIFTLTDPDEILSILVKALDNRSNFELSLSSRKTKPLVCTLTDVHYSCLALELPAYIAPSESWIGREVHIYFAIPGDGSKRAHYFFQTEILDLFQGEIENICILVDYPMNLQQKQKRSHLRLAPPTDQVASLTLWPAVTTRQATLETNVNRFGQPLLESRPQAESGTHCRVVNISASGLRLKLSKEARRHSGINPETLSECIIALDLVGPDEGQHQKHILSCRTRNVHDDPVSRELHIGLQFSALGKTSAQWPSSLVWEDVDPEHGVEDIGNWVIKLHLKLYREKGII